ncbi:MAG: AAA family ATPase [Chloroflexi bacterium]|nr:AAA family ATPase [Chloroflexota bacterium]
MPKIAITGKGGVGKTTLAALLAHVYAEEGRTVLAIDADPAASLAFSLGFPAELAAQITPIAEMDELIFERTGAQRGATGGYFRLNPRVDDIPDRFSALHRDIRLLRLGTVKMGGAGCICPESALLRNLVTHLLVARDEVVILDMEAGIEHLGRGTAQAVDAFLIVVEPNRRSLSTAMQIHKLATDIGVHRVYLVGNKVGDGDRAFLEEQSNGIPIAGLLPVDERVNEADRAGIPVFDAAPRLVECARQIAQVIG